MKVVLGRVGGVLVLALMRACRLLPEPEIRTAIFAGEDILCCCRMPYVGGLVMLSNVSPKFGGVGDLPARSFGDWAH